MDAKEKNRLTGIFLMIHGGLMALMYLAMLVFFGFISSADPGTPKSVLGFMTIFISVFAAIFVAPQIIGGWKIYNEQPNARNWGIAGGVFACLGSILGIAAGVFALIFLFGEEGKRFYDSATREKYLNPLNATDDFNYQNYQQQQPREPHSWK